MSEQRYNAFISYSHSDERWAKWLHRALENYRVPGRLVGRSTAFGEIPRNLYPIFRDRDELRSAHVLGEEIQRALRASRSLVLICSKAAAESAWVNEEVRYFKSLGRSERIFCLIVEGAPDTPESNCFPPAVLQHFDADGHPLDTVAEPVAADARPGKDGKSDAKLKLLAGILDVPFSELKQRQLAARNSRLTMLSLGSSAIAILTIGLAVVATQARKQAEVQRALAVEQREVAEAQRQMAQLRQGQAEGLVGFMLGDLRKRLEPIGKLQILDSIGDQAMAYFAAIEPSALSDQELAARARALRQIGDVRAQQGKLAEASPAFAESLRLDQERVARSPDDEQAIFDVAQSQFYIGYDHYLRGEFKQALPWFERYEVSADHLLALNPGERKWRREKLYALDTLATIQTALGNYGECIVSAQASLAGVQKLRDETAVDPQSLDSEGSALFKAASCYWHLGKLDQQQARLQAAQQIYEQLLALAPADRTRQFKLAVAKQTRGVSLLELGQIEQARTLMQSANQLFGVLRDVDRDNTFWQVEWLRSEVGLAEVDVLSAEYEAAAMRLAALDVVRLGAAWQDHQYQYWNLRFMLARQMNDKRVLSEAEARIRKALLTLAAPANKSQMALSCGLLGRWGSVHTALPEVCSTVVDEVIAANASRLALVLASMRHQQTGQSLPETAAGQQLISRDYHGAIWALVRKAASGA